MESTVETAGVKSPNYGQWQALKVLAAERLGLVPSDVGTATGLLEGKTPHVMLFASLDKEASRVHNVIRGDAALVEKANGEVLALASQYGFKV